MGDEAGRLLICADVEGTLRGSISATDLTELTTLVQQRFPDHPVELVDLERLRQLADERRRSAQWHFNLSLRPLEVPPPEYVLAVLGWLGGAVSKQAAEQAIKTTADLIKEWMRSRRREDSATQVGIILGPDGEVLKKVEVRPSAPVRRKAARRHR